METIKDRIVFDATVAQRTIYNVPVNTITHTPYNPVGRTKEGARLNRLIESIRKHGLAAPILITLDRDVIDGNRRLAACRALGMETIECIICDMDQDEAFTEINIPVYPLGGKAWLEIGRGGGYLPPKEAGMYGELHDLIGSYGIDLLIRQNLGLNVLPLCKQAIHVGVNKKLAEVILLTATKRLTNKINTELRTDKPDEKKAAAINKLLRG